MPNEAEFSGETAFFEKVGTETSNNPRRKSRGSEVSELSIEGQPMATGPIPRWSHNGDMFWPASETCATLPPGIYRFDQLPNIGVCLHKVNLSIDNLIRLPDSATEKVLAEFSTFWGLKDRFVKRGFLHKRGILLWGPPGCLAATTQIHYQAFVNGQRTYKKDVSIERLYQLFHNLQGEGKGRYQTLADETEMRIASVDDAGRIISNRVINVIKSGPKTVYRLTTVGGYTIVATKDHKFLSNGRYIALGDLRPNDAVEMHLNNAIDVSADGGGRQTGRKYVYVKNHPIAWTKVVNDRYGYKVLPTARAVIEAEMNRLSLSDYIVRLNDNELDGLQFLSRDQDVHHKDEDCTNDAIDNLAVHSHADHARLHQDQQTLFFTSSTERIRDIEILGDQETYDIEMETPYHNFVADKFIVHNSGKTASLMLMAQDIIEHHGGIVCQIDHPSLAGVCLAHIRKIEPDRPIIALIEDLDALVERHGENQFLSLLDGETQVDRIVYVACPAPETLVLKSDLTWVRADTLHPGDELIAFDEHNEGYGRRYRTAQVRSAPLIEKARYRVTTEMGTTVVSEGHPFLIRLGNRPHEWRLAEDLRAGNKIASIGQPWKTDTSCQSDGEGMLNITFNENARILITCYPIIISVEPIGIGAVVALDTTTNTFIGDGYLQHNTTNYPERLDKRFVDRPSRFDTIEWIGMPGAAARRAYLQNKESSLDGAELDRWVNATDGFSVAHLRELVILVKCFDRPLGAAIQRLEAMRLRQPKSNDAPDKPIFGIVGNASEREAGWKESAANSKKQIPISPTRISDYYR